MERDEKGLFVVGNKGGPGRPKKAREEAYLNAVLDALTPEQLTVTLRALLAENSWRAQAFATEIILHYGLGKPVQRVETADTNAMADLVQQMKDAGLADDKTDSCP